MTIDLEKEIVKLKEGQIKSFELIYTYFSKSLFNYIYNLVKEEEQTFDILQLTFIKIWNNKAQLDEKKSFQAYLFRIASNLAIDHLRLLAKDQRKQDELWATISESSLSVEEEYLIKERKNIINQLIEKLPFQQQQVFILCKIEGYSYAEAAEKLNLSNSTVSNHLTAAIKTIRVLLYQNKNEILFIILIINKLV